MSSMKGLSSLLAEGSSGLVDEVKHIPKTSEFLRVQLKEGVLKGGFRGKRIRFVEEVSAVLKICSWYLVGTHDP